MIRQACRPLHCVIGDTLSWFSFAAGRNRPVDRDSYPGLPASGGPFVWAAGFALCLLALLAPPLRAATTTPAPVTLGSEIVALDGPWKFRIGDNLRWASSDFDDAMWESVDLTPQFGSHDADVGLMGYVPGWEAQGHRGYTGYAWYRLRISVNAPAEQSLALVGPTNVDSAYQIYVDGHLLGGVGDFSHSPPAAFGTNRPSTFPLASGSGPTLIAVRVWMGAWDLDGSDAGGIHIAPALGTKAGAEALYRIEWMEVIRGYFLDVVLAAGFIVLGIMVCSLTALTGLKKEHLWLAAALLSVAFMRANQAVFYWAQIESVRGFELITNVLLVPAMLGTWTIAWATSLRLNSRRWILPAAGALAVLLGVLQALHASWFYGNFPKTLETALGSCIAADRLLFAGLTLWVVLSVARQRTREKWLALTAIVLISTGLFAQELSQLGLPGIWFPFGTGVSRTQYAYAAFDLAFFALMLRRALQMRTQAQAV